MTVNNNGGIALDGRRLLIADSNNQAIRVVDLDSGVISHFAGTVDDAGYAGDGGSAAVAKLNFPADLAVDSDHSVYVADTFNSCLRRIDPAGVITTVVGRCGEKGSDGDGGPADQAHVYKPYGIDVDRARHVLYIADTYNHVIRRVNL